MLLDVARLGTRQCCTEPSTVTGISPRPLVSPRYTIPLSSIGRGLTSSLPSLQALPRLHDPTPQVPNLSAYHAPQPAHPPTHYHTCLHTHPTARWLPPVPLRTVQAGRRARRAPTLTRAQRMTFTCYRDHLSSLVTVTRSWTKDRTGRHFMSISICALCLCHANHV